MRKRPRQASPDPHQATTAPKEDAEESLSKDDLLAILKKESQEDDGGDGHFDPGDDTTSLTK